VRERIERAWKIRLHVELASDPRAHAWALGLYRAGERHPETVADYFPVERARDAWPELAAAMKRHAGDERRHAALYGRAIADMGQPIREHEGSDVFNCVIREHTPISWAIDDADPREVVRVKLAHFLAHAHTLEKRIARSLEYHVEACAIARREQARSVVARVLADESRHVAYTGEAVRELTTHRERAAILAAHQGAERRADRAFSARQLRTFLAHHAARLPARDRIVYAASVFVMENVHVV
jgi:hypothetical protein